MCCLNRLGEAHKCEAYVPLTTISYPPRLLTRYYHRCRRSRETHDKRHREIAVLVEAILELDGTNGLSTPVSGTKRKARKSDDLFDIARDVDEVSVHESDLLDNASVKDQDTAPPSLCTPNLKGAKREQKLKKAERKMAKSQSRVKVIATEEISRIADVIHPRPPDGTLNAKIDFRRNSDDLLDSKLVAENIAYVSATSEHHNSRIRHDYGAKKAAKSKATPPAQTPTTPGPSGSDDETVGILGRLGVKIVVLTASKERKGLIAKLQDAVCADLAVVDNEDRDTMMREAGYFRYVNRRTYNAMIRNNQIWDWVSGRKLEEVDEDDENEESGQESVGDDVAVAGERAVEDYADDFVLNGDEVQLVGRLGALVFRHPAPLDPSFDNLDLSPVTDKSGSFDAAEPATPGAPRKESAPGPSIAGERTASAEHVPLLGPDRDGDEDGTGKQESEQRKVVDTTYAITNLEPEDMWG